MGGPTNRQCSYSDSSAQLLSQMGCQRVLVFHKTWERTQIYLGARILDKVHLHICLCPPLLHILTLHTHIHLKCGSAAYIRCRGHCPGDEEWGLVSSKHSLASQDSYAFICLLSKTSQHNLNRRTAQLNHAYGGVSGDSWPTHLSASSAKNLVSVPAAALNFPHTQSPQILHATHTARTLSHATTWNGPSTLPSTWTDTIRHSTGEGPSTLPSTWTD